MTHPQSRWFAALAGVALLALAIQGQADSRETLGAGDSIRVTVFQNPDLTTETRISERGTIVFPLIGEVALAGQTPTEGGVRIAAQLKQGNYLRNPQVSLSVIQVRSRQVSVLGQVGRPGRYALDDVNSKLTDILALAGGISPGGDDVVTVVIARGSQVRKLEIDVPKMYRSGDLSQNVEVESGDTIYVQRAPVFYIYGEVQRAGAYRLEPDMVVMHALSLGGGLTLRGTDRGLKINRRTPDGSVRKLEAKLTDRVQPDDVIYVGESLF
jgi:polysaccharide export outer membrane protein